MLKRNNAFTKQNPHTILKPIRSLAIMELEDNMFYSEDGDPAPPPHHYYPMMGVDPHGDAADCYSHSQHQHAGNLPPSPRDSYLHSHHQHAGHLPPSPADCYSHSQHQHAGNLPPAPHIWGSPSRGGSALPRGNSAPRAMNSAAKGEPVPRARGSPPKGLSRSPGGSGSSPKGGGGKLVRRGSGAGGSARGGSGIPWCVSAVQGIQAPQQGGVASPGPNSACSAARREAEGQAAPTPEASSSPQQFHHPHFHHHRGYRPGQGKQTAHSPQRSSRSSSVREHSSVDDRPYARYPPVSSYSLDNPPNSSGPGSPYQAMPGAPYESTPDSQYQTSAGSPYQPTSSSAAKRNVAVTDLDQAMQEMDENRLRSLFSTHMTPADISFGYTPGYGSGFGETDVDETDLDDDPVNVKYVTNIHVPEQNLGDEDNGVCMNREDSRYVSLPPETLSCHTCASTFYQYQTYVCVKASLPNVSVQCNGRPP